MDINKIIGIALISAFVIAFLKALNRDDLVTSVSLIVGIGFFFIVIQKVSVLISFINDIATKVGLDYTYFTTILKIMGIAYLTAFSSDICKESGASSIAAKLEMVGKVFILVLAIPIFMGVLDSILNILRS